MAPHVPVTREALLDPEGTLVRERKTLAWRVIERFLRQRKIDDRSLRAAQITLDRYEPAPKGSTIAAQFNAPVVIRWDLTATEIPPVSARMEPKSMRSDGSNGSASSYVIEDGERPPSA